jgi:hypothetical protein
MARKRIVLEVDDAQFFGAAAKLDRATIGDRFIELCLSPDAFSTQVGLSAVYGVDIVSVEAVVEPEADTVEVDGVTVKIAAQDGGGFLATSEQMPEICLYHGDREALVADLPAVVAAVRAGRGAAPEAATQVAENAPLNQENRLGDANLARELATDASPAAPTDAPKEERTVELVSKARLDAVGAMFASGQLNTWLNALATLCQARAAGQDVPAVDVPEPPLDRAKAAKAWASVARRCGFDADLDAVLAGFTPAALPAPGR